MRRSVRQFTALLCAVLLLLGSFPCTNAYTTTPSLAGRIRSQARRNYVEEMLSYHLNENTAVMDTLSNGYSAVFFFEGCSDNMDDAQLQDLSYYRVSAVCIAIRLAEDGEPEIVYFNDACSTLPDRPLEIGAWELEGVGEVGPATVCDGTYELYSVYHSGAYEALHIRTSYSEATAAAVYMTGDAFTTGQATYINIHTRTCNHILDKAMWSAGCLLVGDGDFSAYTDLIDAVYYSRYNVFALDQRVGTVTINRQFLQQELIQMYQNADAVQTLLTSSICEDPGIYLDRCTQATEYADARTVEAVRETTVMSLPCGNETDARSMNVAVLNPQEKIDIRGSIVNTEGNLWYEVALVNERGYVYAEDVAEPPKPWYQRFFEFLF